jgi:N-acyl-D-aspartate/D-glutamate deacylase
VAFLCDAGFGLHLFGHWVREQALFSLEEAVRRVTSVPAAIFGLRDRGRIAAGARADLLLFDPQTVGMSRARRTRDLPGGEERVLRDPLGVHGVWVNGERVSAGEAAVDGALRPGAVLRDFARKTTEVSRAAVHA